MKRLIKSTISAIIVFTLLFGITVNVYAHGVIYDQKMIGENTLRVTLKWSNPSDKRGIVVKSYGIKDSKYIDITYEIVDGKPNTYTKDFVSNADLLPKPVITLYNIKDLNNPIFPDIKGNYAESYIRHLHDAGIINGRPDGTFAPDSTVTRAEFAVMMVSALKLEGTADNTKGLTDINGHWAKNYMLLAVKQGLLSGYSDKTLKPDKTITVAEVSTVLAKAFVFKTSKNGIYPKLRQNQWYSAYVKKMFDAGILTINDSIYSSFDEGIFINRANCAMMISRAISTY